MADKNTIAIYGEVVPFQGNDAIDFGVINLQSINTQLQNVEAKDGFIDVLLHTPGGDVEEGFAIYYALRRYAAENDVKIRTRIDGRCASIGTVIFLAGDERVGNELLEPFVHNASSMTWGDAEDMEKTGRMLRLWNQRIAEHYAAHTDRDADYYLNAMQNETFISPEECVDIRFCTSIEDVLRPVAKQNIVNTLKSNNMAKPNLNDKKKIDALGTSIMSAINSVFSTSNNEGEGAEGNGEGEGVKNLQVQDADGVTLDFADVEMGQTPDIGDIATVDGAPAQGEYLMPSGDTYVFGDGGALESIVPAVENLQALQTQLADSATALQNANTQIEANEKALKKIQKDVAAMQELTGAFEYDGAQNRQEGAGEDANAGGNSITSGMKERIKAARTK